MASVRKYPGSKFWYGCYTSPSGKRVQRSTKETDRKKAEKIAEGWEGLSKGRAKARQVHRVIADIYKEAHDEELPSSTIRMYLEDWLKRREGEVAPSTIEAYRGASKRLQQWLATKADDPLAELDTRQLIAFRDAQAKRVSAKTANQFIKLLRVILEDARRDGHVADNPAKDVQPLKTKGGGKRRPFTVDEVRKLLAVASDEWRSMIFFGVYVGQRIGDIARLTWANIDLEAGEVHLNTGKTGRLVRVPICTPLATHIESLPHGDDPQAPLHPKAFAVVSTGRGKSAPLSREFGQLMASAGLAPSTRKSHQGKGIGRDGKRAASTTSFHSLRHTATSLMKNAGASPAVVQDIIGHDSVEMSAHYTTIESAAKRTALDKLPDLTEI